MVDIHFESGWEQYALPLDNVEQVDFEKEWIQDTPAFYRYEFQVDQPKDTFLNCRELGKGVTFINGFNLGRYWSEGPVQYLYIPAPLLREGKNQLIVFETEGKTAGALWLEDCPVYVEYE